MNSFNNQAEFSSKKAFKKMKKIKIKNPSQSQKEIYSKSKEFAASQNQPTIPISKFTYEVEDELEIEVEDELENEVDELEIEVEDEYQMPKSSE
jgi:hypothetical protein